MTANFTFRICDGFTESQRSTAAHLFWEAFRSKLLPVMKPEEKALKFLTQIADPAHAIGAVTPDGTLVGIAGFKTNTGSFIGGELQDLQAVYGSFGGIWRGLVVSVLERPTHHGILTMDGIMVSAAARGQGVGTALLSAIKSKAIALDCTQVRLDVIDANPRARALYHRQGFVVQDTTDIGPLRHIFGFRKSTTMIFKARRSCNLE